MMRSVSAIFLGLAVVLAAGPAMALTINPDGSIAGWGITPFSDWVGDFSASTVGDDFSPINYPVIGNTPSGGEPFDMEFLGWRVSGGQFQILGVTSFGLDGVPDPQVSDGFWTPGDIFIDVTCDGIYDYAFAYNNPAFNGSFGIEITTVFAVLGPGKLPHEGISDEPGSYGSPGNFNQDVIDQAGAWRLKGGGGIVAGPPPSIFLDIQSYDYGGDEDGTWVWEWTADLDFFSQDPFDPNKLTLHWTIECGNDLIEVPKVPEPATLLLLSSGLAGLAMLRRRKR